MCGNFPLILLAHVQYSVSQLRVCGLRSLHLEASYVTTPCQGQMEIIHIER